MIIKGGIRVGSLTIKRDSSPIPTSDLSLWLKADEGVTLSDLDVVSWADQSGNGNNASPIISRATPVYNANSINSKPSIDFDESFLRIPQNFIGNSGNISIFIALNYTQGSIILNKGDGETFGDSEWEIATEYGFGYVDISVEEWKYATYTQGTGLQLLECFASGGASQVAINGENVGTSSSAPSELNSRFQYIGIGGCGDGGSLSDSIMKIAEIIIYNREVSTPERQQVEAYLNAKYAIY